MKRYLSIIILFVCAAIPMTAQYYSVNYDKRTVAEMTAAFASEAATEAYYAEQVAKIREYYQAAEVAAAGIFTSKFLDRRALTDLGLWTSSTENYYYRRIYNMVSAKIMPKIWTVAGMMLRSPQNALYWGSYLYKVCEETKTLCYQFESIVTNSRLSFRDIAFLEINQELAAILKLSELGDVDWKNLLDNFSDIGSNFTKDNLKADIDNLYAMGVSLASAGAGNAVSSIVGNSNFNGTLMDKTSSVIEIAENTYDLYNDLSTNAGNTLLQFVGGQEGIANLFSLSNYNTTAWITDYAREGMGQYYTQRWYIYSVDQGSEKLCDYYPPTDDDAILYGDHWYRISTTDPDFYPSSSQREAALQNSENHAGWSRSRVQQLNNSNDGYNYNISYYSSAYILSKKKSGQYAKAYAYEIHVTKSWYRQEVKYEDVFDSYSMDMATFRAGLNARLADYNDNEDGIRYYIGSDSKRYYQATNAEKMAGCETATISVTCHDGTKLGEGSTQYKCSQCGGSVNAHTKQCSMATSITSESVNTSEIDAKIAETESRIASIDTEIARLEAENSNLLKLIQTSSVEDAARYRQQYNANKDRISVLKSEKSAAEKELADYNQAKQEAIDGENAATDDYYRIPAIMQDCKNAYNLSWNGAGAWEGNTFVRTASMPNINGTITFKATISIARKPKYFLGIKIHRAIVQISWTLTTEYSDTQVVAVINLDPSKTDQEKADEVNAKLSEIAREYPSCEPTVEYAKSSPVESDDTEDTYHLLWTSDRLDIARQIDSRLTKIYADLVSLEKMMHYKHSIIDILRSIAPLDTDQGRRLTLIERCRKRWLRNAANSAHSDTYNGKYDEEDEDDEE
ncbi:hypothetical protein CIK95_09770 [Prevotella sp. P5-108]|uniref:hypothetical protein n=1 Tax=Prevotella sp. P5-108 TaxID=2024225 RepID=UPI000B96B2F9|nr:hypothetical protein [Prevotella sp. P5-108]OYP63359.1 hypothetical protein CIK95_09770 [Prevotella sp. P5-108]